MYNVDVELSYLATLCHAMSTHCLPMSVLKNSDPYACIFERNQFSIPLDTSNFKKLKILLI